MISGGLCEKTSDRLLNYVYPLLKVAGMFCMELCKRSDESYISCSVCQQFAVTCNHFSLVDWAVFVV